MSIDGGLGVRRICGLSLVAQGLSGHGACTMTDGARTWSSAARDKGRRHFFVVKPVEWTDMLVVAYYEEGT